VIRFCRFLFTGNQDKYIVYLLSYTSVEMFLRGNLKK